MNDKTLTMDSFINNTMNPQSQLMTGTRALERKWSKSGLLEGIKNPCERSGIAVMLENQANQLLRESTSTGTAPNAEQWNGVALPLVRRVFGEIAAKEFVSVQPMNMPSGLIFYLDYKFGSNDHLGHKKGESVFGGNLKKLGSTDAPVNGLYGEGRYGYTSRVVTSSAISTGATLYTIEKATWEDVNFNDIYARETDGSLSDNIYKVSIDIGKNTRLSAIAGNGYIWNADLNAVRSFELIDSTTSTAKKMLPEYAKVLVNGTLDDVTYTLVFLIMEDSEIPDTDTDGTLDTQTYKLKYTIQPEPSARGDFEAGKTPGLASGTNPSGLPDSAYEANGIDTDVSIPEINLELGSEPIVAKTRKLKAVWTPEIAQDLNAYHSVDAEAELTSMLSEYISMEIDLEILDMLITSVPPNLCEVWSAKIGTEYTKTIDDTGEVTWTRVEDSTPNRTAYVKSTWFQTLGNKIQKVSNMIHRLTLRGGANFLVCSPDVATILESIPGFVVNTDGDQAKFAMGVSRIGSFASRFQVYKNPYMTANLILVGFRGNNFLETGAVYAPYIPLIQTPLVYDPINFTPRRGVMTRYAKKIVRPEFYGKIYITDMNMV